MSSPNQRICAPTPCCLLRMAEAANRPVLLAFVGACLTVGSVAAQDVTGNLEGRIIGTDSLPIADVQIGLSGPRLQGVRSIFTDGRGLFRVQYVPVGSYTVRITHLGYREVVIEDLPILLGRTTSLGEIKLEVEAIELEPLVVSASRVVIDPFSTTVGANLEDSTIYELPVDRDHRLIVSLLPHANTSFYGDEVSVGGSTGLENLHYVDGVNVTTPYKATASTRLPHNFVKEIEVREGGYEAQYGGSLGAIVNVITHSGSNRWEANAFGYFTNDALAQDKRPGLVDLPERDFATYDVGLLLSGPIVRDRLWFSAAYNPLVLRRDVEALNQGFFEDRRTEHRFAGKVNWRAADRTDVELSVFGDPTTHRHVGPFENLGPTLQLANPDPFLWRTEDGGVTVSLRGRQGLGKRGVLEAWVARSQGQENLLGDTEIARRESFFHDFRTATTEGGVAWRTSVDAVRTSADLRGTLFLGPHTLTIGGRYEENNVDFFVQSNGDGWIFQLGDSLFVQPSTSNDFKDRRNRLPGFYMQDTWQVSNQLTLNAGLRWDGQYLYGAGDSIAQAFTNQWQPRLGITVTDEERTKKLFGFYGRFYQQRPLFSTINFLSGLTLSAGFFPADPRLPDAEPFMTQEIISLAEKVDGADGEHFDEFTLGYEAAVAKSLRLVARGVYRVLREAWVSGQDEHGNIPITGNPGKGPLSSLPKADRTYGALEFTAEHRGRGPLYFLGSYILSRNEGNYSGLFVSDNLRDTEGTAFQFICPETASGSSGLLPNDRTHALKLLGSYRFNFGLSAGTFFTWQSGTPLNEFGSSLSACAGAATGTKVFLVPRGSAGRTASIWDLSFRFAYPLGPWGGLGLRSRLVLDILHLGSEREIVVVDQRRLVDVDRQIPNPTFGAALVHQPPMIVRFGLELSF